MKLQYRHTMIACYFAAVIQAIISNFTPLLFITFRRSFGLSLEQVTMLVTVNFLTQLIMDALCIKLVDRIGHRVCIVFAQACFAVGILGLAVFPAIFPSPFAGLLAAVITYAVGGGITEVMGSPIAEACPSENKEAAMSMLHSFFCWGSVLTIVGSTVLFSILGIENWRWAAAFWALFPVFNTVLFSLVPLPRLVEEGQTMPVRKLASTRIFWVFMLLMICAGASELSVSQWASAFAESALGVSKTVGDLAGPCFFAVLMGLSRLYFAKAGGKVSLTAYMLFSAALCLVGYGMTVLFQSPVINLLGCGICGFAVAIMWPGTLSLAAVHCPTGGTAMFAILALGGDIGCSLGPSVVGLVSGAYGDNLKVGLSAATVFPILIFLGILLLKRLHRTAPAKSA